jgi:Leucine-rich repeat (LRR) protein
MDFNIEEYINSLPLDTKTINVSSKKLTYLPNLSRFKELKILDVSFNQLTCLPPLSDSIKKLLVNHNQLTELPPLPKSLLQLCCYNNQLTWLPSLNINITHLFCHNNNFYNQNIEKYNNNCFRMIETLNNFRYTYYLLKFKKHFKRWLWEKVREPKVMAKFHPDHLNELQDTDDLEVFLDNWIKK